MKRTPMKRRTPLRVHHTKRKPPKTKYATRERAFDYMGWVKRNQCIVAAWWMALGMANPTACSGAIEADHMGERGTSRKAPDSTCAPMCTGHHRERHDFAGSFKAFKQADMRSFLAAAIQITQHRARECGIAIPTC